MWVRACPRVQSEDLEGHGAIEETQSQVFIVLPLIVLPMVFNQLFSLDWLQQKRRPCGRAFRRGQETRAEHVESRAKHAPLNSGHRSIRIPRFERIEFANSLIEPFHLR